MNIEGKVEELEKIVICENSISDLIDKNNIDKSLSQYVFDNYNQFN